MTKPRIKFLEVNYKDSIDPVKDLIKAWEQFKKECKADDAKEIKDEKNKN